MGVKKVPKKLLLSQAGPSIVCLTRRRWANNNGRATSKQPPGRQGPARAGPTRTLWSLRTGPPPGAPPSSAGRPNWSSLKHQPSLSRPMPILQWQLTSLPPKIKGFGKKREYNLSRKPEKELGRDKWLEKARPGEEIEVVSECHKIYYFPLSDCLRTCSPVTNHQSPCHLQLGIRQSGWLGFLNWLYR